MPPKIKYMAFYACFKSSKESSLSKAVQNYVNFQCCWNSVDVSVYQVQHNNDESRKETQLVLPQALKMSEY